MILNYPRIFFINKIIKYVYLNQLIVVNERSCIGFCYVCLRLAISNGFLDIYHLLAAEIVNFVEWRWHSLFLCHFNFQISVSAFLLLFLLLFELVDPLINDLKLIAPVSCINYRPLVQSCVVAALRVKMERWSHRGHFMSIQRVMLEKQFDFICKGINGRILSRTVNMIEHRNRAKLIDSSQLRK